MPRVSGSFGKKDQIESGVWFERETRTYGEFYTPEDTVAIKRAMLGDEDAWIDTIAAGKGTTRQVYYPTYDYGTQKSNIFHATGITHAAHIGEDHATSFSQLTRSETQQVEAAWRNMKFSNDGMNYWDVQTYFTPDGVEHRDLTPKAMSMWNIENDGEKWGWNDVMIGELQRRLTEDIPKAPGFEDADPSQIFEVPRSGSGSGSRGPVYVEPMRSVIEDTVKAMLTSLTGDEPDARVQELTDDYLAADKARWKVGQEGGVDIVPNQIVLDKIRQQDDYKRIHELRAESDSETGWIAGRNQRLQQLGLGSQDADERAVFLAQAGTNLNDIDTGAFQTSRGMKDITLMGKIKKAASNVAGQL